MPRLAGWFQEARDGTHVLAAVFFPIFIYALVLSPFFLLINSQFDCNKLKVLLIPASEIDQGLPLCFLFSTSFSCQFREENNQPHYLSLKATPGAFLNAT